MSAEKLAKVDCAAQAERKAKAHPRAGIDINCQIAPCPASQPELFVVPVRYALAEEQALDSNCAPGVTTQSRPMAVRRLRPGFLYIWQNQGPLVRYAVSPGGRLQQQPLDAESTIVLHGTLNGLALKKIHNAWMLYSEYPLNAQHCQALSDSSELRNTHMRQIKLRSVANDLEAEHCPALKNANNVMAELLPDSYARAMKAEHKRGAPNIDALGAALMKDPNKDTIKAYTDAMHQARERENIIAAHPEASDQPPGEWSSEPWEGQATQVWLEQARAQADGLFAVFACLDDDLGVLRDINQEQEQVEAGHEQWMAGNSVRLTVGGFIRSLITEDGAELAASLSYRYKDRELSLSAEQGKVMLNAQHQLDAALKTETQARQYGGRPTATEAAERQIRIATIVAPVRAFIPADLYPEIEAVVREYRAEKQANLNNDMASAKVSEYIDLPTMNHWLETTAPAHFQQIEQRHAALLSDRGQYLKRSKHGTWFVDYADVDTRQWLTELATGCLTAQCLRAAGAQQYADYVRAADGGALTQLFSAWTPALDAILNSTTRLDELMAALADANIEATHTALAPLTRPILNGIANMAREAREPWNVLVNRLSAALLLLKDENTLGRHWMGVFIAARLGGDARLQAVTEGGRQVWKLLGEQAENLSRWARNTGKAIGAGWVGNIINSPGVANSGGLVPLATLLLNLFNASNHLNQAGVVEGMDGQRVGDAYSATLYTAAALAAVIDSQVRNGLRKDRFFVRSTAVPTLTLFGGVIGGLSAIAAFAEHQSLQNQLESAQTRIDPWLEMRQSVVGAQIAAYGAQGLLGVVQTGRALAGIIEVEVAIARYSLWMGPLNWIIAALGVLHLITWYFQQTPLQNFLSACCWSKARAKNLEPIAPNTQHNELTYLYDILYTPRVSMDSHSVVGGSTGASGIASVSVITALTIDLPGAEPGSVHLEMRMIGDPVDTQAHRYLIKNRPVNSFEVPRPWRDLTPHWLSSSTYSWIPFKEGQGLRLSGPFNTDFNVLGSEPDTVSLRLRYRTPLTGLLGTPTFVGGERGVAFTLRDNTGVIALRNDPTPELDRVPAYRLSNDHSGGFHLQPKDKV